MPACLRENPAAVSDADSARSFNGPSLLLAASIIGNVALVILLLVNSGDDIGDPSRTDTSAPAVVAIAEPAPREESDPVADEEAGPTRVLVVGDSVGAQIGWGLQAWSEANPGEIIVMNEAHLGCGVVRFGEKLVDGEFGPVGDICSNWNEPVALHLAADPEVVSWPSALELFQPDVVLSVVSSWDITDRIVPGVVDDWASVGDPAYDAYVLSEYTEATSVLAESGADVYWLMSATLNKNLLPENHFFRVGAINSIVRTAIGLVEADVPDAAITKLDYQTWLGETGAARDQSIRDDGVHLSDLGRELIAPWLLEEMGLT
ncbi:MAG: hypothetical protein ACI9C1_001106 [Candidatus Aldehydirespiratoraceae bacterium]